MSHNERDLSFKGLLGEALREIGSPDRGFLRTTWLLCIRPGRTAREIFSGLHPELSGPIRYFLIAYSLYALFFIMSGAQERLLDALTDRLLSSGNGGSLSSMSRAQLQETMGYSYYLNYPLITALITLVQSWLACSIALWRTGLSASQKFALNMYVSDFSLLPSVALSLLIFLGYSEAFSNSLAVFMLAYLAWVTFDLSLRRRLVSLTRGVVWTVLIILLYLMTTFVFIVKEGLIKGAQDALDESAVEEMNAGRSKSLSP